MTIWEQDEVREWLARFERDVLPNLKSSAMSITIYSGKFDSKLALELGAAILLDKPIMLVVVDGAKIPPMLEKVAIEIVRGDPVGDEASRQQIINAITRTIAKIPKTQ